ncbi:MAG: 50S ribosomal protein L15 [Patescibacteria group bacterium]|nr:50S ribosomal protein L15 [Patescibacteria group bacterium]
MNLENLKKLTKNKKRKGRGISAGSGKTAGRGTKGQKSRTGKKLRPGFEGGQMPLIQRIPKKRGFKTINPKAETVTTGMLTKIKDGSTITSELLKREGLVKGSSAKIVDKGEVKNKFKVRVKISKNAAKKIKKAGGSVEL